jgi:phage replication-related protein YjqB (UPF0714/DUF867 family)
MSVSKLEIFIGGKRRDDNNGSTCETNSMADRYRNFAELAAHERENTDFQVRSEMRCDATAFIAPHGGGIEPGTSELAEAIARADFSFYAFEGLKEDGNGVLHVTSNHFDEPIAIELVSASPTVVAVHGELKCIDKVAFLGGLDKELGQRIRTALEAAEFIVRIHDNPNLQGVNKNNICNRGRSGQGVQLEMSQPLRMSFFESFDRSGRERPTKAFSKFVDAIRGAILGEPVKK